MSEGPPWNPYAVRQSTALRSTGEEDLRNLTIVATILLSMSMLTLALYLGGIAFNLAMGVSFDPPPGFDQNNVVAFRIGQIGSIVLPLVCQLLAILGSVAMIARKKSGLAWAGAISGLLPFCGPCLGLSIPFAIWAMVLLQRPGVVAAFQANSSNG
jgi:hypothetical protein